MIPVQKDFIHNRRRKHYEQISRQGDKMRQPGKGLFSYRVLLLFCNHLTHSKVSEMPYFYLQKEIQLEKPD